MRSKKRCLFIPHASGELLVKDKILCEFLPTTHYQLLMVIGSGNNISVLFLSESNYSRVEIIIIISVLPYGRSLAPNSSILLYSLLFSSSSQRSLPSAPLAYQSLVCPSASCPPFYPPSLLLIVLLLAKHVQSNSFYAAQSSPLIS